MHFLILLFLVFVNAYTTWVYFVLFVLSNLHMNNHLSNYISIHGQVENLENSETFSEIFKSEFSIWLQGKIENLEIRKLGIMFPRFPRFPRFPSFRFATFHFSKNFFFQFSTVGNSVLSTYVLLCFQRLLKCFFLHQKYMFKILPCHNEIYLF